MAFLQTVLGIRCLSPEARAALALRLRAYRKYRPAVPFGEIPQVGPITRGKLGCAPLAAATNGTA
jgi:hypothetical protein